MQNSIIIGIHGLLNKPSQEILKDWWAKAIAEGLYRNYNITIILPFELAYWADIQYPHPIPLEKLEERYEKATGEGPLKRYDYSKMDKTRAVLQKWGGRLLDKEKELFGLGSNVEHLLGIKFSDLADYYNNENKRQAMRSRLSTMLEQHKDKRIFLIAHSMGSIITYDVLRTFDDSNTVKVEHFATIGSPLGLPIVGEKIGNEFGKRRTPNNVLRWINIADPGDKVSLDCNLADEYKENAAGVQVIDILVHNEYVNHEGRANNHKSYGYLRAPEVSDLIKKFLSSIG